MAAGYQVLEQLKSVELDTDESFKSCESQTLSTSKSTSENYKSKSCSESRCSVSPKKHALGTETKNDISKTSTSASCEFKSCSSGTHYARSVSIDSEILFQSKEKDINDENSVDSLLNSPIIFWDDFHVDYDDQNTTTPTIKTNSINLNNTFAGNKSEFLIDSKEVDGFPIESVKIDSDDCCDDPYTSVPIAKTNSNIEQCTVLLDDQNITPTVKTNSITCCNLSNTSAGNQSEFLIDYKELDDISIESTKIHSVDSCALCVEPYTSAPATKKDSHFGQSTALLDDSIVLSDDSCILCDDDETQEKFMHTLSDDSTDYLLYFKNDIENTNVSSTCKESNNDNLIHNENAQAETLDTSSNASTDYLLLASSDVINANQLLQEESNNATSSKSTMHLQQQEEQSRLERIGWRTKKKPQLKCFICRKKYRCLRNLKLHLFYHREEAFFCEYCDKGYRLKCHLTQHINRQHNIY